MSTVRRDNPPHHPGPTVDLSLSILPNWRTLYFDAWDVSVFVVEACFLSVEGLLFLDFEAPFLAFAMPFFFAVRFAACFAGAGATEVAETVVAFVPEDAAAGRSSAADAVVRVARANAPTKMRALIEFINLFVFRSSDTLRCRTRNASRV